MRESFRQSVVLVALVSGGALALLACGKDKGSDDERSEIDPALAAIEVDAATVSDVNGTKTVTIDASSPNTQIVRASAESRITGTQLSFPPGAFDIDFDVSLEEGKSIATKANLTKLIDESATVLASAPAVVVTWTYDQDTFVPYKLKIPMPAAPEPLPAGASLVLLQIRNQVGQPKRLLGIVPGSALAIDGGFATFEAVSYGVFQMAYVNKSPTKTAETETGDKQQSIGKISGVTPGAFQITGPTAAVANAADAVSWDPADLAESYTLKLDQASATCAAPYFTVSVTTLSVAVANAKDGESFVCVSATNAAGSTAATNDGTKLTADRSAPPVPAKPSTNGPVITTIEPTFTWQAVTDVGPSGLAYYQVEIGTSPGAADMFNGAVTDTTKSIIGFHGKTYYARVSAVDNVGNQSEFSPVSSGVLVDSE